MAWAMVAVALGFAGLGVLAYCAFRVFLGVRTLASEVERTRGRLEPRRAALARRVDSLRERT